MHVSVQVCALAKPTIRTMKSTPASRGAAPKRPAEPHRAEGRHEAEAAPTARWPSGGGGPGIEATAETPSAEKPWTAPYSAAQSRPSIARIPGRGAVAAMDGLAISAAGSTWASPRLSEVTFIEVPVSVTRSGLMALVSSAMSDADRDDGGDGTCTAAAAGCGGGHGMETHGPQSLLSVEAAVPWARVTISTQVHSAPRKMAHGSMVDLPSGLR